jgi:hypothetical protein
MNGGPLKKRPTVFENDEDLPSDRKHLNKYQSDIDVKPVMSPRAS